MGLLACYEAWVCGRSWVRAPAGAIVRRVFHPAKKLVRLSLLKCPSIPNSKFGSRPRGEVSVIDHLRLPLMRHPATLKTMPIPANYNYYYCYLPSFHIRLICDECEMGGLVQWGLITTQMAWSMSLINPFPPE